MRNHIYYFFFLIFAAQYSFCQSPTPNAGFEDWTTITFPTQYQVPNNWDELNEETNFIGILTCIRDTANPHSGNSDVKLITKVVTIFNVTDTANGIISTGRLITSPPYGVDSGIAYHERPDSIAGWIRYFPTAGDSCQIEFDLKGSNNDTIGKALFQAGATLSNWTRFSAPVVYYSGNTPDTSLWLISSSNGFNSLPNSTLYIDDLSVIMSTGIPDLYSEPMINVNSNLVKDQIIISNKSSKKATFNLYNMNGELVIQQLVVKTTELLSANDLANGMYFYEACGTDGALLNSGKVVVQH